MESAKLRHARVGRPECDIRSIPCRRERRSLKEKGRYGEKPQVVPGAKLSPTTGRGDLDPLIC